LHFVASQKLLRFWQDNKIVWMLLLLLLVVLSRDELCLTKGVSLTGSSNIYIPPPFTPPHSGCRFKKVNSLKEESKLKDVCE